MSDDTTRAGPGGAGAAIAAFPRTRLAHLPTPLEFMPRLTDLLGGPRLYVKRDDCTGLAFGGNKARQLEFYLGDALAKGADTIVTTGAVQSNHVRMTAAACRKLGLGCEVQLEDRVGGMPDEYRTSGSPLLNRIYGATIHTYPEGENEAAADRELESIAGRVRENGGVPYVIHLGPEHPPLGALGYLDAVGEILEQADEAGLRIDAMVVPTGSGSTHLGILAGLRLEGREIPVHGICIRRRAGPQKERLELRARRLAELIGAKRLIEPEDFRLTDAYLGPGYGQTSPEMFEAVFAAARCEGLLVDPIYSGKALAGLMGLVRAGAFPSDANVLFLHTGGTPALFGYRTRLEAAIPGGKN
ncbi:MAG: D-cysteine desulfhydrase family protein [Gammaproteobacteria bacterium]|nr:D-cysteine desulfhydrase family protein [Gammaproteobacteria bacterium]